MDLSTIRPRLPLGRKEAAPEGPNFEAQLTGRQSLLMDPGYSEAQRITASMAFNVFARLRERRRATGRRA